MNNLAVNTQISPDQEPEFVEDVSAETPPDIIPLSTFIQDFGPDLLNAVKRQNPPVYNEVPCPIRASVMDAMLRRPFDAQQRVV